MRKMSYILAILCLLGCIGCGRQENSFISEDKINETEEREDEKIQDGVEQLQTTIANTTIQSETVEELTPDQKLSNLILGKTTIEKLEENEDSFVIKVVYPDVATLLLEETEKEASHDELVTNKILDRLVEKLEKNDVVYIEKDLTVFYSTEDKTDIIWDEELMNALSGGLLEVSRE